MSAEAPPCRCSRCDRVYPPSADEPHRCDCGGVLELVGWPNQTEGFPPLSQMLQEYPISLPAGRTPCVEVPELGAWLKLETCNPTGSFKDRGAALVIARACAIGVEAIREDSSGNAGRAIAAFAANADIEADIYVPRGIDPSTRQAIECTGATLIIEADRTAAAKACLEATGTWYASHAWRPSFYAGTATMAAELVEDLGGRQPDTVVLPVGHGTLLLGLFRGFESLRDRQVIDDIPRLYAAQLAGAGSLLSTSSRVDPKIAPGVRIDVPARESQVRSAIEASGGDTIAVPASAVSSTRNRLCRIGFDVCSTAALGVAGRLALGEDGRIAPDETTTVPVTGRSRDR